MIEFKNHLTGTLMAVAPEREDEYLAEGHTRVDAPAAVPARQPAEEPAEEPAAKQTAEEPAEEPTAKQTAAPAPKKKAAARK